MSAISKRVVREFANKEFRDEYTASRVRSWIAYQIKALRQQRGWSQEDFAARIGTSQGNVSKRLENPDYGKFSLQTLLDVAAACDVALTVNFVDHLSFLTKTSDLSVDNLKVAPYSPDTQARMERVTGAAQRTVAVTLSGVGPRPFAHTVSSQEKPIMMDVMSAPQVVNA